MSDLDVRKQFNVELELSDLATAVPQFQVSLHSTARHIYLSWQLLVQLQSCRKFSDVPNYIAKTLRKSTVVQVPHDTTYALLPLSVHCRG